MAQKILLHHRNTLKAPHLRNISVIKAVKGIETA